MCKVSFNKGVLMTILIAIVAFALGYFCGITYKKCPCNAGLLIEVSSTDSIPDMSDVPNSTQYVLVDTASTVGLNIYYPNFSHIDLVCGEMPSKFNDSIIFMVPAAYTREKMSTFSHSNIVGPHVADGEFYAPAKKPKGAFSYYDNTPHFAYGNYEDQMRLASQRGGCAFSQDMMICNCELTQYDRNPKSKHHFRALCLFGGRLAIVDSKRKEPFELFVKRLQHLNVSDAIYLDMGDWSYSWYRDRNNNVIELGNQPNKYATNWLVFYK